MFAHQLKPITALLLITLSSLNLAANAQSQATPVEASRSHLNLGNAYLRRQAFKEALDEYQKSLSLNKNNQAAAYNLVLTHINWGNAYFQNKQYDQARQQWEAALKLSPNDSKARYNLQVLERRLSQQYPPPGCIDVPDEPQEPAAPKTEPAQPAPAAQLLTPTATGASKPVTVDPQAAKIATPPEPSSTSAPSPPAVSPPSLEDMLGKLETKIYGQTQSNMSVLKRLEKLEIDTSGQTTSGSIKTRVDALVNSWKL